MATAAKRGCHLKGTLVIPFLFMMDTEAASKRKTSVRMPRITVSGWPRIW